MACSSWGAASQRDQEKAEKRTPAVICLTRDGNHRLPLEDEIEALPVGDDEQVKADEAPLLHPLFGAVIGEDNTDGIWKHLKKEGHRLLIRKVEASTISLLESKKDPRLLSGELATFLNNLPNDVEYGDTLDAMESSEFENLNGRSWGLLLSSSFHIRFAKAIKRCYANRQQQLERKKESLKRLYLKRRSPDPADRLAALYHLPSRDKPSLFRRVAKIISQDPDPRLVLESAKTVHRHYRDISRKDHRLVVEACQTCLATETNDTVRDELQYVAALIDQ